MTRARDRLRSWRKRLRAVFFRRSVEQELAEEMAWHVEAETAHNIARGMSPSEARRAALLAFGGTDRFAESVRDVRDFGWLESVKQDTAQAVRSYRRTPGLALVIVLTLALGIGGTVALFSVVNGLLIRPLPYPDADRILYVQQPATRASVPNVSFSFMEIDDFRAGATMVDEIVEYGDWDFTVVGEGQPHRAVAGLVTANYFDVLGLRTALGRPLRAEDDAEGAEPVLVLTHAYWQRAFGGDPGAIGRMVTLSGKRARIVGVLEPGVHYTGSRQQDFFVNYASNDHYGGAAMLDERAHRMTSVFARLLKPHVGFPRSVRIGIEIIALAPVLVAVDEIDLAVLDQASQPGVPLHDRLEHARLRPGLRVGDRREDRHRRYQYLHGEGLRRYGCRLLPVYDRPRQQGPHLTSDR